MESTDASIAVTPDAPTERQALELLAATVTVFAESLDYRQRLASLARVTVPALADWCIVDVLEDETVKRVAVECADPSRALLATEIAGLAHDQGDPNNPVARVLRSGRAEIVPDVSEQWLQRLAAVPGRSRVVPELGIRSIMILPVLARGRTLGAITFITAESGRRYTSAHLDLAAQVAQRAALAVDDAWLYREAQSARAEANRRRIELERVMKSRALLMRRISHDVKNPLGVADGYAHLLEQGALGDLLPKQGESVRRIRRSIQDALRLILDLLDVARAEAGHIDVDIAAVDVREVVREAIEDYRQSNAGLNPLSVDVPDVLPTVHSDGELLPQLLGTLLTNAAKSTPRGGTVAVRARVCESDELSGCRRTICVDVTDGGPGIPREVQATIFDEFGDLTRQSTIGASRGLPASRRMAWALGGDLTVESEPSRGSTFTLSIPVGEAVEECAAAQPDDVSQNADS